MEIKRSNGNQVIDFMAKDYDSFFASMQELVPAKLPEWTDHESETDFGNVLMQTIAHACDVLSYYQDRVANEAFLGTARERRNVIQHLKLIGYKLGTAAPAATNLTLQFPQDCMDTLTVVRGDAFATKSRKDKPSVRYEYNGETRRIDCSALPVDPVAQRKLVQITVEEGRLVKEDILGVSDGTANQRFTLSYPGLILRSIGESGEVNQDISLWTELGGVVDVDWRLQESLAFSREGEKDYVIEIDENDQATVAFGSGSFGAIVASGATVKAGYRVGGGLQGNVPAGSIDTIAGAPALSLVGATCTNKEAASGGSDRESIENAVLQAPRVFRSFKRAVARGDYESLALRFPGVGKVRAERGNWNTVSLFVAPQGGGRVSDILKANLLAYFEDKRPISTIIEIEDVDYVKVYIEATVGLASYYARSDMQEQIELATGALLAFDNVDFKDELFLSKVYEAIEGIEGVEFATVTRFQRDGDTGPAVQPEGRISLGANEIPRVPGAAASDTLEDADYRAGIKLTLQGGY